jgi:hypothetical protein
MLLVQVLLQRPAAPARTVPRRRGAGFAAGPAPALLPGRGDRGRALAQLLAQREPASCRPSAAEDQLAVAGDSQQVLLRAVHDDDLAVAAQHDLARECGPAGAPAGSPRRSRRRAGPRESACSLAVPRPLRPGTRLWRAGAGAAIGDCRRARVQCAPKARRGLVQLRRAAPAASDAPPAGPGPRQVVISARSETLRIPAEITLVEHVRAEPRRQFDLDGGGGVDGRAGLVGRSQPDATAP